MGGGIQINSHKQNAVRMYLMQKIRTRIIRGIALYGMLLLLQTPVFSPQAHAADLPLKKVLYISSYHPGLMWSDRIWEGIEEGLANQNIELFIEFLDSKRLPPEKAFKLFYEVMRVKYAKESLDAIITSDDNALQFVKDYGKELFPGIPIVFCGANDITIKDIEGHPNILGVDESRDIEEGIRVMLQLHPYVDRILVVIDKTITGQKLRKTLEVVASQFSGVTFTYADSFSLPQLLETVTDLKKNALIFYFFFYHDSTGAYFNSDLVAEQLVEVAKVPIYTISDTLLGKGLVGGMITSAYYQGLAAGELTARILASEPISSLPRITKSPNKLMFDYPALIKAGLTPGRLPKGSIVLNRPVSFYNKYKRLIWVVSTALTALLAMVILMGMNILQRKKVQNQLAAALEELKQIFDNTQAGIVLLTAERTIWRTNQSMADLFGFDSPEEMIGLSTRDFHVSEESFDRFARTHLSRLREGEKVRDEYRFKRRDGVEFWALIAGTAISRSDPPDFGRGALFIVDDVTDRKEAEMALEKLNLELESKVRERTQALASQALQLQIANTRLKKLDNEKSSMLSSVSHDLRTPLTSIRGFVKLIGKNFKGNFMPLAQDSARLQKHAEKITDNLGIIDYESERLTRLINDFLDLAKIESGQLVWRDTDLAVDKLINQALDAVRGQFATLQAVRQKVEIADGLPALHADGDRIMQVLINLLNNAAKHTEQGTITISAHLQEQGDLQITISDTGSGIPPEHLPKIFDKFHQVENGDTLPQQGKGTGLGLAICREIISHYNGRIWAESVFGAGSTFSFTLPVSIPS